MNRLNFDYLALTTRLKIESIILRVCVHFKLQNNNADRVPSNGFKLGQIGQLPTHPDSFPNQNGAPKK